MALARDHRDRVQRDVGAAGLSTSIRSRPSARTRFTSSSASRSASLLIVSGLLFGPQAEPDTIDEVSSASLGAYLAVAGLLVLASRHDPVALATFAVLVVATVAIAWRTAAAMAAVPRRRCSPRW